MAVEMFVSLAVLGVLVRLFCITQLHLPSEFGLGLLFATALAIRLQPPMGLG